MDLKECAEGRTWDQIQRRMEVAEEEQSKLEAEMDMLSGALRFKKAQGEGPDA